MTDGNKFCIVCDLPDGINAFQGFHKEINPLTGGATYSNVWNTNVKTARLFRSRRQADIVLKMVDGMQIVYARVETYGKVLTLAADPENIRKNQSNQN